MVKLVNDQQFLSQSLMAASCSIQIRHFNMYRSTSGSPRIFGSLQSNTGYHFIDFLTDGISFQWEDTVLLP
jgi:hypothetical protein